MSPAPQELVRPNRATSLESVGGTINSSVYESHCGKHKNRITPCCHPAKYRAQRTPDLKSQPDHAASVINWRVLCRVLDGRGVAVPNHVPTA